ncbi:hypothetical protein [Flavobacterium geliluteum]|uniref:Uncharacterized protein n=1 Tax=Flavobacterium geliluteum TaxID=2816120 RepID=A0A940X926_9FLAO|nr:hypothetical protein [Flavobacterium geliluteum]MBP4138855.1 hypothetical protein [Flavobacterium geliluteum]
MKDTNDLKALKKTWESLDLKTPIIEQTELKKIIHQNSQSVVKKILIISLIEFLLSILPYCFKSKQYLSKEIIQIQNSKVIIYLDYIYYIVFMYFVIQFYINFKKININSNLNNLSKNILNTRKSVYNYIYSSLIIFNLNSLVFAYLYLNNDLYYKNFINSNHSHNNLIIVIFYTIVILFSAIVSFSIWHIYKILYIRLIKQLDQNFDELNK